MPDLPIDFWNPLGYLKNVDHSDPNHLCKDFHHTLEWIFAVVSEPLKSDPAAFEFAKQLRYLLLSALEQKVFLPESLRNSTCEFLVTSAVENSVIGLLLSCESQDGSLCRWFHFLDEKIWMPSPVQDAMSLNRDLFIPESPPTWVSPLGAGDTIMPPSIRPSMVQGGFAIPDFTVKTKTIRIFPELSDDYIALVNQLNDCRWLINIQELLNRTDFKKLNMMEFSKFCQVDLVSRIHAVRRQ